MDHSSPISNVLLSAGFAGYFSGYFINGLEVVKTTLLNKAFTQPGIDNSRSKFRTSSMQVCADLFRKEGVKCMLRGSTSQCLAGMVRAPINISLYEYILKTLKKTAKSDEKRLVDLYGPAGAVLISKSIAVPFGLKFEQMATLAQGGARAKASKSASMDGLGFILGREVLFSVAFWTLNEHLYKLFRLYINPVSATTASAFISGMIGGMVSYPMDALRTWKINFPEKFHGRRTTCVLREIVQERGVQFLLAGSLELSRSASENDQSISGQYSLLLFILSIGQCDEFDQQDC